MTITAVATANPDDRDALLAWAIDAVIDPATDRDVRADLNAMRWTLKAITSGHTDEQYRTAVDKVLMSDPGPGELARQLDNLRVEFAVRRFDLGSEVA